MVGLSQRAIKESPTWDHMKSVIQHICAERPQQSTEMLESLSSLVYSGNIVPEKVTSVYQDNEPIPLKGPSATVQHNVSWAHKTSQQILPPKPPKRPVEDDEEQPEEEEPEEDKGELPDIATEQAVFNKFGEGLVPDEAFRIQTSLKRLLDKEPLAKVRFWGKIIGRVRNYYIAETKIDEERVPEKEEDEADELDEDEEGKLPETIMQELARYRAPTVQEPTVEENKGPNEFVYYVAISDDPTTWVRLPDVTPAQITVARQILKMFVGDLNANIDCQPPFPGTEKNYLRAQIARISFACTICPKDINTAEGLEDEEEELDDDGNRIHKRFEVKPYEEIPALNPREAPDPEDLDSVAPVKAWFGGYMHDELLNAENWVHIAPTLLAEGRVTKFHPEEEKPDEDEEEDDTAPEERVVPPSAQEYINPFLSNLKRDLNIFLPSQSKKLLTPWSFRKAYHGCNDKNRFYLARSLLWPGALCYAVAEDDVPVSEFQNLYCGYGVKTVSSEIFSPQFPPLPCKEFSAGDVKLMRDATYDDELEFLPVPKEPKVKRDEEEEEEE